MGTNMGVFAGLSDGAACGLMRLRNLLELLTILRVGDGDRVRWPFGGGSKLPLFANLLNSSLGLCIMLIMSVVYVREGE